MSTLTYELRSSSPRDLSGTQARSSEDEVIVLERLLSGTEGETSVGNTAGFCWIKAMKPAMLSLAEGVG